MNTSKDDWKLVCYCQRSTFTRFQSYLLGEHDVGRHQVTIWNKTPATLRSAVFANLLHVGGHSAVDPVFLASNRAAHIEIPETIELNALFGR